MISALLALIYLAFISLGLPDALLGAAWPTISAEFRTPVSCAGIISMIIALGTVLSSLMSERLTSRLGTGKVTAFSVATTAVALLGFSVCRSFWQLCILAIPYGLGAGSVDASLNNYVALHYESKHMSWLHCMWGVGASVGPYIMGLCLTGLQSWNMGYRIVGLLQVALTVALFFAIPLWKKKAGAGEGVSNPSERKRALHLTEVLRIPGAKAVMIAFFCYCALEQTAGLWAASYLHLYKGISSDTAASFASFFFVGLTVGRAISGFLTLKLNDTQMIWLGNTIIGIGIAVMLLAASEAFSLVGLVLIGLGCAPIYPCIIHSTPTRFGAERSQALIGVQMASAYVGICLMPPLFGLIAKYVAISLLPVYLLVLLAVMVGMFYFLERKTGKKYQIPAA